MSELGSPSPASRYAPSNINAENVSRVSFPTIDEAKDENLSNNSDDTIVEGEDIPVIEDAKKSQDSSTDTRAIKPWAEKETIEGENEVSDPSDGISNTKDLEGGQAVAALARTKSAKSARDPNIVTWEGEDDPQNPKNWPRRRKWAAILIVSSFAFISPVSSTMIAPALPAISAEFNMTSTVESQLTMSIFVFAYGFGPLLFGPMSELYGRVPVTQLANLLFLAFNLGCGAAKTKEQMMVFRFLAGLGGSSPMAVGGGLLSDVFDEHERGQAISVYSLAPMLGPAIGPIAGGFITQYLSWRWVFWVTSIADAVIQISGVFFLQETYAPKLLSVKCKALRGSTGNMNLTTVYEDPNMTVRKKIRISLVRPFRLLFTQPIVQFLSLYMFFIFGLVYIVLSIFPKMWMDTYHESLSISSLNYMSLGIGYTLASQIAPRLNDVVYRKLRARNNGIGKPEFRVPFMITGSILVPIGLFWYGWAAQARNHWIITSIGVVVYAAGVILVFLGIQAYLIDAYTRYAASAIGASAVVRSFGGFGLPLFAPTMYKALGYGWGNSIMAFVAIGLGVPAPLALWRYGEALRKRSPYAAGNGAGK